MTDKEIQSYSLDPDVAEGVERLAEEQGLNRSAIVNQFWRDYLSGGLGREAALEQRLNRIDEEIADHSKEISRLERERDRIEEMLSSHDDEVDEVIEKLQEIARRDREKRGNPNHWREDNPAIQKYAAEVGIPAQELMEKVEATL